MVADIDPVIGAGDRPDASARWQRLRDGLPDGLRREVKRATICVHHDAKREYVWHHQHWMSLFEFSHDLGAFHAKSALAVRQARCATITWLYGLANTVSSVSSPFSSGFNSLISGSIYFLPSRVSMTPLGRAI